MSTILVLAAAAAAICGLPPEAQQQSVLSYSAFDERGPPDGWRSLNGRGCVDEAVRLLKEYADANDRNMSPEQRNEIRFHIGQTLAFAGRDAEAIYYFEKADDAPADAEWAAYVAATVAFLRRDTASLSDARLAYARAAPDSMRLKFIDGFVACPRLSYREAVHCAM